MYSFIVVLEKLFIIFFNVIVFIFSFETFFPRSQKFIGESFLTHRQLY